jgi:hypothetical protein
MAMLMVGGCHVFMPKFDAKLAVGAIEQYAVTSFITVPAMITGLNSIIRYVPVSNWNKNLIHQHLYVLIMIL